MGTLIVVSSSFRSNTSTRFINSAKDVSTCAVVDSRGLSNPRREVEDRFSRLGSSVCNNEVVVERRGCASVPSRRVVLWSTPCRCGSRWWPPPRRCRSTATISSSFFVRVVHPASSCRGFAWEIIVGSSTSTTSTRRCVCEAGRARVVTYERRRGKRMTSVSNSGRDLSP